MFVVVSDSLQAWLRAGHFIGLFIWIAGLATVYWLLRLHVHAPKDVQEKLTLAERAIAIMMDIGATLAIGAGLAMAIRQNVFTQKPAAWFHIKLTIVVLGILSVHGMIRARIGKFSRNEIKPVPQWWWSLLLVSLVSIAIVVTAVRYKMTQSYAQSAAEQLPASK